MHTPLIALTVLLLGLLLVYGTCNNNNENYHNMNQINPQIFKTAYGHLRPIVMKRTNFKGDETLSDPRRIKYYS